MSFMLGKPEGSMLADRPQNGTVVGVKGGGLSAAASIFKEANSTNRNEGGPKTHNRRSLKSVKRNQLQQKEEEKNEYVDLIERLRMQVILRAMCHRIWC